MNQIQKQNRIDITMLNQGEYFQSLFLQMCNKQLLTQTHIERIQYELIELLGKEVERFTNGESSSVLVEKAQEILHSITYCIGLYLKSINDMDEVQEILSNDKIISLFHKGMDYASELKDKAALLLNKILLEKLRIDNYAYQDTITEGIPEFFPAYEIEFASFDVPGCIDYPLLETIIDLQGVEYIYEYLHRLNLENDFLRCFSEYNITMLLNNFNKDSKHMLINIFEMVLTNALGCDMAGGQILNLNLTKEELSWLDNRLRGMSKDEIAQQLTLSLSRVGNELNLSGEFITYSGKAILQLTDRIVHNLETDTLQELFIIYRDELPQDVLFEDGISMEDEELRKLIDELGELNNVSEKMVRIREKVRSLSDLVELLQECFYGSEYEEVFNLLSDTDITMLMHIIEDEAGPELQFDYLPEKEWQKILLERYKENELT